MKRNILAIILLIFVCFVVYGQDTNPIDLVLLLDTSSGMSSSYENVNNYITGALLTEFLRTGDTFHLITFSGTPMLDIVRRVSARGDIETIIGRMMLQYPVERGSNIAAAVTYAEQYITSLPSRPKKIVIVSTAASDTNNIINAARQRLNSANTTLDFVQVTPGQPLTNLPSSGRSSVPARTTTATTPAATTTAVTTPPPAVATTVTTTTPVTTGTTATTPPAAATTVTTTPPAATGTSTTTPPAAATTVTTTTPAVTGTSTTTTPPATTTVTTTTTTQEQRQDTGTPSQPSGTQTVQTTTIATGTSGTSSQTSSEPSTETTSNETSIIQDGGRSGTIEVQDSTPSESTGTQRSEQETTPARTPERLRETGSSQNSSMPFIIGIIVLLVLILGLVIFFASRRLGSSPNRVVAEVASGGKKESTPFADDHSKDLAKYAAVQTKQRTTPYSDRPVKIDNSKPVLINPSGPLLINLFVEDQNTAIGKRNIHSLKSGYSLTIGGGKSDFLIFLVQIPPNIGEVHRDGSQLTFIPRKSKYFPDLGSNELRDCLSKTIRVISDRHYEMRIRFEMYEDPLIALNRMLTSVSLPG